MTSFQRDATKIYQSDWADFAALEDDDDMYLEDIGPPGKMKGFADENDSQELKAEIGSEIEPPPFEWFHIASSREGIVQSQHHVPGQTVHFSDISSRN